VTITAPPPVITALGTAGWLSKSVGRYSNLSRLTIADHEQVLAKVIDLAYNVTAGFAHCRQVTADALRGVDQGSTMGVPLARAVDGAYQEASSLARTAVGCVGDARQAVRKQVRYMEGTPAAVPAPGANPLLSGVGGVPLATERLLRPVYVPHAGRCGTGKVHPWKPRQGAGADRGQAEGVL